MLGIFIALGLIFVVFATSIWQNQDRYARYWFTAGLSRSQKIILKKHFKFYHFLPPESKKIFEFRVAKFVSLKTFVPRDMDRVTEEMKILVAASAIQLTFGYPRVFLSYFKYILIYPDHFFSETNQQYHKGEVNPKQKAIVLSWRHFVEGFAEAEGVNLGLHEMAHALQLENVVINREHNFIDQQAAKHWQELANREIRIIRKGEDSFFRAYGGTNHHEFFAVAVEYFFECPGDFAAYSYELYAALAKLLRQDPLLLYKKL